MPAPFLNQQQLATMVTAFLPRLLAAMVLIGVFWMAWRFTAPLLRSALLRARLAAALVGMIVDGLYKGTVVLVAAITAASQLGVNITAALAGLGVAGVAIGFAAQETVANMIAGFLVFWDRPFKIGDFITTLGRYGQVQEITMRTTRIRTMENAYVVIPNREIIGELLVNHSMYGEIRVNVPVGIAYKEDIATARAALLPALAAVPGVLAHPAPDVVAHTLADSSVTLHARVWIADAAAEQPTASAVLEACKVALDRAGIEIPFPHLQLFVEDVREPARRALATLPALLR